MKQHPTLSTVRRTFRWMNAGIMICGFVGMGFMLGALEQITRLMPDNEDLWSYRPRVGTEIYSTEVQKDGSETHTLLARVYNENREPVELRQIPEQMVQATIAIEDRRFYEHRGVSPRDMARAAYIDITHKSAEQGASTITQQLVRNLWLTKKKTWDRKLKEAVLALQMERKYSKDEILEMYLNQVCYGHGVFGVKAAAKMYYGKNPEQLTLAECALLAGLPQWPVGYSPYRYPERCQKRRDSVLAWMQREGFITAQQQSQAKQVSVKEGLQPPQEQTVVATHAPHFTNLVLRELCDQYGYDAVYQGGLRVYTTLDVRLQKAAEEELTEGVEDLRSSGNIDDGLNGQGALCSVEVKTGRVLAMVGGVGPYEKVQYNRAAPGGPRYGRQPGSSFKPYVWAAALENGYGPESVFSGDPITIQLGPGQTWSPKNYTPRQSGNYTLRWALAQSVNLVSVRIVQKVTPGTVQRLAARMLDIPRERLRPVLAMALGTSELSPMEQATGYCAFANGGLRPTHRLIRRIEDYEGKIVVSYEPEMARVIRPATATSMLSMLGTVVESGTGRRARACGLPCGGKTGTTNGERDVWFVGFTPDLSTAVWVGNDNNAQMRGASGGGLCAPIWADFTRRATEILGVKGNFPEGEGARAQREEEPAKETTDNFVTICVQTGLRATRFCPVTKEMALKKGQAPPGYCTVHGEAGRNAEPDAGGDDDRGVTAVVCPSSGLLATPYCPASIVRRYSPGEAPAGYCTVHGPSRSGNGHGGESTDRPRRGHSEEGGGQSSPRSEERKKPSEGDRGTGGGPPGLD